MEIQKLFKLIKSLTCQANISNLVRSLESLLETNFEDVQLVVYELQAARVDNNKTQYFICVDCLGKAPPVNLNENHNFFTAFMDKEKYFSYDGTKKSQLIFPVVLYDKSVSHLITVEHSYKNGTKSALLIGLMDIFTDVFRSIHEKGYDPLTRILNRQAFDQVAADLALSNSSSPDSNKHGQSGKRFKSIAILDIDKFKSINDGYGHAIGDETLVLFAQTVRSILRQGDLFFRYGGEEFVIFVKEVKSEQAYHVLERCRAAIESRRFPQVGQVTVSIGFTDLSKDNHPIDDLSKADKALYYIKNNGRNQVKSYEYLLENKLLEAVEPIKSEFDFWD